MGIPWFSLSPLSLFSHATVPRQTHSTVVATSNVAGAKTLRKGKLALCWEELWSQEHETSPHGFFLSLFSCPRDLNKGSDMEACGRTGYQRVEFLGRGPKRGALGNWKVQGRLQKGRSSGQWLCIIVYELLSHVCLDQILISILTILRTKVMRRAQPNSHHGHWECMPEMGPKSSVTSLTTEPSLEPQPTDGGLELADWSSPACTC